MRKFDILGMVVVVVFLAGCSRQTIAVAPSASGAEGLKELVQVYDYLQYSRLPPPKQVKDLDQFAETMPSAYAGVQSGDYTVVWGVSTSKAPLAANQVLAYETKAPTEGGAVLLRDGTVKQMTAAEFNAAPKATK